MAKIKQIAIKQSDGSYVYRYIGADAQNVDFADGDTLADKMTDWDAKQDGEQGKGLSTEDYSSGEKAKLATVSSNAEENVIEAITVNGTALTPDANKQVSIILQQNFAPISHASVDTTYGIATDTLYGHVKFGTIAGTAIEGNDSRLSNSRTPIAHAVNATTYGAGNASNYGHIKIDSSLDARESDATVGVQVNPVRDGLDSKGDTLNYDDTTGELQLKSGNTVLDSVIISSDDSASTLAVTTSSPMLLGKSVRATSLSNGKTVSTNNFSDDGIALLSLPNIDAYNIESEDESTIIINSSSSDLLVCNLEVENDSDDIVEEIALVPWATGSDDEIGAMIDAYYAGYFTLEQIQSVWSIGDKRAVTIDGVSVELEIIDFNHDNLTLEDNDKAKALVTVDYAAYPVNDYVNSTDINIGGWADSDLRAWCNSNCYNGLPAYLKSRAKAVDKLTSSGNYLTTLTTTSDKVWLLSEVEIFGEANYSVEGEGSQYEYYTVASNRYKSSLATGNITGAWWNRSPSARTSDSFCGVDINGLGMIAKASKNFGIICGIAL